MPFGGGKVAGGYDGSLRFNTKIDADTFMQSIGSLEKALTSLERTVGKMTTALTGSFDTVGASAEQAADQVKTAFHKPIGFEVETADFHGAYDTAAEKIKSKLESLRQKLSSLGDKMRKPSEGIGAKIGNGISRGIEQTNPLNSLRSMLKRAAGLVASYFGIRALVTFGKQSVTLASDIDEVQNVVDTAFGEMSYKMEDFAATSVKQFGISRLTAKQTGSTFMAMAHGMGVASDAASDMAVSLTGLSADFASFYNVEQDVAATALNSVFTGETETLKKFGIVMTEANLQQFALNKGIKKSVSAMTQAEKVQLRYAYVMNQGSLAIGDFAKTSGGWANQVRIMQEQWKEFSSQVGVILKNVFLPIVRRINAALSSLIVKTQSAIERFSDLFGWETDAGSASTALYTVSDGYDDITDAANDAASAMDKTLSSYDEIHKLGDSTASAALASGVGAAASVINPYAEENGENVDASSQLSASWKKKGKQTIDEILASWEKVKGLVSAVKQSFSTVFENGTAQTTLNLMLALLRNIIGTVGNLAEAFRNAWKENDSGTKILQTLWNILNDILLLAVKLAESMKDWAGNTDFSPLLSAFAKLLESIERITGSASDDLQWLMDNILKPLATWTFETALPLVIEDIGAALDALNAIWQAIKPFVYDIMWEKFLKPIAAWTADKAERALRAIGAALKYIAENFGEDDAVVLETAGTAIIGLIAAVKGYQAIQSGVSAISALWSTLSASATLSGGTVGAAILAFFSAYEGMSAFMDKKVYDGKDAVDWWAGFWDAGFVDNWKAGTEIDDAIADFADDVAVGYGVIGDSLSDFGEEIKLDWEYVIGEIGALWDVYIEDWGLGWETIKQSASDGWENTKTTLNSGWETVTGKVDDWKDNWRTGAKEIKENASQKWSELKENLGDGWSTIKESVSDWHDHWGTKLEEVKKNAGEKWSSIKETMKGGWPAVKEKVTDWKNHWDTKCGEIWNTVSSKWDNIKSTLQDSEAWQKISGKLSEWQKNLGTGFDAIKEKAGSFKDDIVKVFEKIWGGESGSGGIKGVVNNLLGGLESMFNWIINRINALIDEANKIDGFSVFGRRIFDIEIPELKTFSMPRLATGTVVPANYGEFAAILGDNKREPEVVSPISAIKAAVQEALDERGSVNDKPIVIQLVADGKKLAEVIARYNANRGRITNGGAGV